MKIVIVSWSELDPYDAKIIMDRAKALESEATPCKPSDSSSTPRRCKGGGPTRSLLLAKVLTQARATLGRPA